MTAPILVANPGTSEFVRCTYANDVSIDAAELAALRKDAERYRWLQANMTGVIQLLGRPGIGLSGATGDCMDSAIDAAMSAEGAR